MAGYTAMGWRVSEPGLEVMSLSPFLTSPVLGLNSQYVLAMPSSRVLVQTKEMRHVEGLMHSRHSWTPTSALGEASVSFALKGREGPGP